MLVSLPVLLSFIQSSVVTLKGFEEIVENEVAKYACGANSYCNTSSGGDQSIPRIFWCCEEYNYACREFFGKLRKIKDTHEDIIKICDR